MEVQSLISVFLFQWDISVIAGANTLIPCHEVKSLQLSEQQAEVQYFAEITLPNHNESKMDFLTNVICDGKTYL